MMVFKHCTLHFIRFLLTLSLFFFVAIISAFASESDTIQLQDNQMLFLKDTIYFGIKDSVIIIENGIKYKIKKESPKTQKLLFEGYKGLVQRQESYEQDLKDGEMLETRKYFEPYKGKIIRKIYYKQVDLLEGSVADTSIAAITDFGKFLSSLHTHSKPWVIKNSLRFRENDKLNEVVMSENERLLRGLPYIEDAKIYINNEDLTTDSVDVFVVTKDNFPIGVGIDYKDIDRFILDLYSKNVGGLGHEAGVLLEYNGDSTRSFGYGFRYAIENVDGSFARTEIEYLNLTGIQQYRLNTTKPFLTNDVEFGGELDLANTETVKIWQEHEEDTSYEIRQLYKANTFDIWLGKSFFITQNVYDKFINAGVRFFSENYLDRPYVEADSNFRFHDNHSILANVTFQEINYYKTNKLLGYGVPEDVPFGYILQLTGGYRTYEFSEMPYVGFSAAWTNKTDRKGYYLTSINFGGLIGDGKMYDNMMTAKIKYFSPLYTLKKFEVRNIIIPTFVSIKNPLYLNELNFDRRIRGLNQYFVHGFSSFVLRYESFFYTPYSFAGFKTAFAVFADSGWIASKEYMKGEVDYYGAYGIGIHIKNESLTIPTMSVELVYYPHWRDQKNKFDISFNFSDLRFFRDLQMLKPSTNFIF